MKKIILLIFLFTGTASYAQLVPDTIYQELERNALPTENHAIVRLKVYDLENKGISQFELRLLSKDSKTIYIATTDYRGEARFLVPIGKTYHVGVDSYASYTDVVVPDRQGIAVGKSFGFQPTQVEETLRNDTVEQQVIQPKRGTTSRAYVNMLVNNFDKEPLPDEEIYFSEIDGNKVYKARTNRNGMAEFLLPLGKRFMLHLKYESEIDIFDLTDDKYVHSFDLEYTYIGSKKVEEFYDKTKRNKNGYLTEFMESEIAPRNFDGTLEKTDLGYNLIFPSESNTASPAVIDNKLFSDGGYHSRAYYCFDPETGRYRWGVELADGGPSSTIYEDGVVLINTQSCTLYALLASTGKLLWSKWLGPNIYSTPSVANGKVYAVYPDQFNSYNDTSNFVIVCFDLKEGNIIWQNRMDAEVLAAPVIADEVYCTSLNGTLYQFDADNGKLLAMKNIDAVSPPMVVDDKVYVSYRTKKNWQQSAIFSTNGLNQLAIADQLGCEFPLYNLYDLESAEKMNYNGCRMLHYKGRNYNVLNNRLVCSDPENGSVIWSKMFEALSDIDDEMCFANMPIVVNDQILVSSGKHGKILAYNPKTGALINSYDTKEKLFSHPIVSNGWIYSGGKEGKMISVNTGNKKMTGWPMWNYNGSHNPVIQ